MSRHVRSLNHCISTHCDSIAVSLMPSFQSPFPSDVSRLPKRKFRESEQSEITTSKRHAPDTAFPLAQGASTQYWMVQWYVSFRPTSNNRMSRYKGEFLKQGSTRHGRGTGSSSWPSQRPLSWTWRVACMHLIAYSIPRN